MIPLLTKGQTLNYPIARRDSLINDYFGTKVSAPYQWMENQDSSEVDAWVEAENKVTFDYLDKIPFRNSIRDRITRLWNYEKVGVPSREGGFLFYNKNSGLQNQSPGLHAERVGIKTKDDS